VKSTIGRFWISSTTKNATRNIAAPAKRLTIGGAAQPSALPSISAQVSRKSPALNVQDSGIVQALGFVIARFFHEGRDRDEQSDAIMTPKEHVLYQCNSGESGCIWRLFRARAIGR
jgi:hypothetical protein